MNNRDDEIITKYACGHYASYVRDVAELHGGIDRVANDEFIFTDGLSIDIMPKPKSMLERWAEEDAILPADWLQVAG